MPAKKHIIRLEEAERTALEQASLSNRRSVREKTRARILLLSDQNRPRDRPREEGGPQSDTEIARQLKVLALTVSRARAHERGLLECLVRQEQPARKARALDGAQEAALVVLTCSAPPDGAGRWTLRLLRERLIEMEVVESIGLETIRSTLKKTRSSPGCSRCGASHLGKMPAL